MLSVATELEVVEVVRSLVGDIYAKKYFGPKNGSNGNVYAAIQADARYTLTAEFLQEKYEDEGYGVVALIKEFDLPITYPVLRTLILNELFGFPLRRGQNVVTDRVRRLRSERAVRQINDATSQFGQPQRNAEYTGRGIQGYYTSPRTGRKYWLRSTYEYIFAKWLDAQHIAYDTEVRDFRLPSGEMYRPDFFIFDADNTLTMIVEVKGYWQNRVHKPKELADMLGIQVAIVTDILNYTRNSYEKEKREWKRVRLLG